MKYIITFIDAVYQTAHDQANIWILNHPEIVIKDIQFSISRSGTKTIRGIMIVYEWSNDYEDN